MFVFIVVCFMRLPCVVNEFSLKIILRKDFYEKLDLEIKELLKITNTSYFEHHLVENYYNPNFLISSFMSNEEWQDLYWKDYWHNDSLERKVYKNAIINGSSVSLWTSLDNKEECMEKRKIICKIDNGVTFGYKISPTVLESFSFGWLGGNILSSDFLNVIDEKIQQIKSFHLKNFYNY